MKYILRISLIIISIFLILACSENSKNINRKPYAEELAAKINRGLVIVPVGTDSIFISWRKLPSDLDNQNYSIWKKENKTGEVKFVEETYLTNYVEQNNEPNKYSFGISRSNDNTPNRFYETISLENSKLHALSFNLETNYKQVHVVTGDLTGDGELEYIIRYSKMKAVDPFNKAWMKSTDSFKIIAFKQNGEKLWETDLGFGIEAGRNFAPMVVWDLDADGKCEVILKTNKSNDPKNYDEEYLTILNGLSGDLIRETRWPSPASSNFNSNSRNYIAIAHLDGKIPSIIVARGLYYTQRLCSYDIHLNKQWERIIGEDIEAKFENKYLQKVWRIFNSDQSRGSHSLPIADVDENGSEEIFWGEHVITSGGEDLWKIEEKIPYSGHLDIVYPADIIKSSPGKEVYFCREGWGNSSELIGVLLVNSKGHTIWSKWGYTHVDGGWAAKVIPGMNDWQFFGYDVQKKNWNPGEHSFEDPNQFLLDINGEKISNHDSTWIGSFTFDWEGDGIREIITNDGKVKRYNNETVLELGKDILWCGDILGDHREEIVYAPQDGKVYIIFNTDRLSTKPLITKLADRQYKNDLSRTAMQFNVIPTESGYIPLLEAQN